MATRGRSALFSRLMTQAFPYGLSSALRRVGDAFEAAFENLRGAGNRDEYIYKAALTQRILLGTHRLSTACMLNEFRVGDCKADLAILNGTATVYEIKSERDSLSRLHRQIDAYQRVFERVYVIAGERHVREVLDSTDHAIGVLRLSSRYQISTVREAMDRPDRICPMTVLGSLRANEARLLLETLGIDVADVPNTRRHAEFERHFRTLKREDVLWAMVKTLKRTRDLLPLSDLVDRLPPSLQAAALSVPVRRSDHERLVDAVHTPMREAMSWA